VATLAASLKSGVPEYTLGVYTDIGGHAILPIGVEFPSADIAHIKVYDSNWPNADRYVAVNLKEQTWSFAFSGADPANDPDMWTGGKGDIDITPFSARASATCPFCGDKSGVQKSLLLVRSALPNWSIETADGTITPGSTDLGDTSVRPVRAAGTTTTRVDAPTDYLVSTTIGATGITLHLGSTARVSGVTPDAVFEVNAPKTTSDTPVTITNTSVAVDDPKVILTVADKNLVASGAGDANTVSSSGDAVSVELTTTDGKVVTQEATPESPAIEVRTGAAQGVTEGISYEVLTQVSTTQVEKLTVATDGKETTTKTDAVLDNQKQTVVLPDDLKAPDVKGGLSPLADRDASPAPPVKTDYIVGDTGPAGGLVFYKAPTRQSWGQYLEVAVVGVTGAFGCEGTEISGADGTAIGTGRQNTIDILAVCKTIGIAARIAADYRGGGKSDWYLPSKDELSALGAANKKLGLGYFGFLWASTESDANSAWWHGLEADDENITPKSYADQNVAPIRSF